MKLHGAKSCRKGVNSPMHVAAGDPCHGHVSSRLQRSATRVDEKRGSFPREV